MKIKNISRKQTTPIIKCQTMGKFGWGWQVYFVLWRGSGIVFHILRNTVGFQLDMRDERCMESEKGIEFCEIERGKHIISRTSLMKTGQLPVGKQKRPSQSVICYSPTWPNKGLERNDCSTSTSCGKSPAITICVSGYCWFSHLSHCYWPVYPFPSSC